MAAADQGDPEGQYRKHTGSGKRDRAGSGHVQATDQWSRSSDKTVLVQRPFSSQARLESTRSQAVSIKLGPHVQRVQSSRVINILSTIHKEPALKETGQLKGSLTGRLGTDCQDTGRCGVVERAVD